jgi:hypothetical protein
MTLDNRITLVVADGAAELERHTDAIDGLAAQAVDPNPYYEPWFMMPLLRAFGGRQRLQALLIYAAGSRELLGFLPFERKLFHRRLPLACLRLWRDPEHWVLRSTPLIRQGALETCVAALFGWLAADRHGPRLVDLPNLPGTSAFSRALAIRLDGEPGLRHLRLDRESHLYRRQASLDIYLAAILDGDRRRNLNRRARRLAEQGALSYVDVDDPGEGGRLIDDFLVLEACGWKGGTGTAMANRQGGVEVAEEILHGAWRRGRLSLLGLRVGGRLVAARSVLLAPPGGFGFKMAYDETEAIARCSPGYLLELEGLRRLHDDATVLGGGIGWLDTCADDTAELARATRWEPLPIHRIVIARRGSAADAVVALLPRFADRATGGLKA